MSRRNRSRERVFEKRTFVSQACSTRTVNPSRKLSRTPVPVQMFDLGGHAARTLFAWLPRSARDSATSSSSSSRRSASAAIRPRSARSATPSASPHRPRSTATSTRCSGSATCAATRPSRVPSRCATTPTAARSWSAGRFATCPLVGDVAAGTNVLAEENVEELLPVPVDFTGDGELFMLRVRGDSMIEARHPRRRLRRRHADQPIRTTATSWSPASPTARRRSRPTAARGADVTLTPANSTMEPMTFTRRSGRDLRQGRHRDAPVLTTARALTWQPQAAVGSSGPGRLPAGAAAAPRPRLTRDRRD